MAIGSKISTLDFSLAIFVVAMLKKFGASVTFGTVIEGTYFQNKCNCPALSNTVNNTKNKQFIRTIDKVTVQFYLNFSPIILTGKIDTYNTSDMHLQKFIHVPTCHTIFQKLLWSVNMVAVGDIRYHVACESHLLSEVKFHSYGVTIHLKRIDFRS